MKKRIIFGSIMIVVLTGLFYLDWFLTSQPFTSKSKLDMVKWFLSHYALFPAVTAIISLLAINEMSKLTSAIDVKILPVSAIFGTLAIGLYPYWNMTMIAAPVFPGLNNLLVIVIGLIMFAVFIEQMARYRIEDAIRRVAATVLTIAYIGGGMAMVLMVRLNLGLPMLIMFMLAVKCTDIGAYFVGSAIGKHKMIPWLSPGKSWEGLIGGVVFTMLVCLGLSILKNNVFADIRFDGALPGGIAAMVFGLVAGITGQFGDLCESLLKRAAAAKDSGAAVPGFGGVLDIIDSPLLAATPAYITVVAMQFS